MSAYSRGGFTPNPYPLGGPTYPGGRPRQYRGRTYVYNGPVYQQSPIGAWVQIGNYQGETRAYNLENALQHLTVRCRRELGGDYRFDIALDRNFIQQKWM